MLTPGPPWLSDLLGDPQVAALYAADHQSALLRRIEGAWTDGLAAAGHVPTGVADAARRAVETASLDVADLAHGTARDGVVVPALVQALRAGQPSDVAEAIHTGLTSQDVIDAAATLTARDAMGILADRLDAALRGLDDLRRTHGDRPLMGRTRMQAARATTMGTRLAAWSGPLRRQQARLDGLRAELEGFGFGGAVGDGGGVDPAVADAALRALGLRSEPAAHAQRDVWVTWGGWLTTTCGAAGKIGADIALMAQQGIGTVALRGGGGSSAMPHKQNPVAAETLQALAIHAAGLQATLHQAMVHEQERSGRAWTLEWITLPALHVTAGASLRMLTRILGDIDRMGER